MEGTGNGLIFFIAKVLSWHLPGGTVEANEKLSTVYWLRFKPCIFCTEARNVAALETFPAVNYIYCFSIG
jgi:hypothetical protein